MRTYSRPFTRGASMIGAVFLLALLSATAALLSWSDSNNARLAQSAAAGSTFEDRWEAQDPERHGTSMEVQKACDAAIKEALWHEKSPPKKFTGDPNKLSDTCAAAVLKPEAKKKNPNGSGNPEDYKCVGMKGTVSISMDGVGTKQLEPDETAIPGLCKVKVCDPAGENCSIASKPLDLNKPPQGAKPPSTPSDPATPKDPNVPGSEFDQKPAIEEVKKNLKEQIQKTQTEMNSIEARLKAIGGGNDPTDEAVRAQLEAELAEKKMTKDTLEKALKNYNSLGGGSPPPGTGGGNRGECPGAPGCSGNPTKQQPGTTFSPPGGGMPQPRPPSSPGSGMGGGGLGGALGKMISGIGRALGFGGSQLCVGGGGIQPISMNSGNHFQVIGYDKYGNQMVTPPGGYGMPCDALNQQGPGSNAPYAPGTCSALYWCSGSTLVYRQNTCVDQMIQSCRYGCMNGTCAQQPIEPPKDPTVPSARISCAPYRVDEGMNVAISYQCGNSSTAEGRGFATDGTSGSAYAVASSTEPNGNSVTYSVICANGSATASASCEVGVNRPTVIISATPSVVRKGTKAAIGWVSVGTGECRVSSPDLPAFTALLSGSTRTSGVATTTPLQKDSTVFVRCTTLGGGTREASVIIRVSTSTDPIGDMTIHSSAEGKAVRYGAVTTIDWNSDSTTTDAAVSLWVVGLGKKEATALIASRLPLKGGYTWRIPKADDPCVTDSIAPCGSTFDAGNPYAIQAVLYTPKDAFLGGYPPADPIAPTYLGSTTTSAFTITND